VRDARGFTDLKWRTPDDMSMIMGRRREGNESHKTGVRRVRKENRILGCGAGRDKLYKYFAQYLYNAFLDTLAWLTASPQKEKQTKILGRHLGSCASGRVVCITFVVCSRYWMWFESVLVLEIICRARRLYVTWVLRSRGTVNASALLVRYVTRHETLHLGLWLVPRYLTHKFIVPCESL
jgi:hypothetical protein